MLVTPEGQSGRKWSCLCPPGGPLHEQRASAELDVAAERRLSVGGHLSASITSCAERGAPPSHSLTPKCHGDARLLQRDMKRVI
eukprot:superscaffoldBa00005055_g19842